MKKMLFAVLAALSFAASAGTEALAAPMDNPAARSGGSSDAWLTAKVKTALVFHSGFSATDMEVESSNGVVTLRGTAEDEAQKERATEYVRGLDGVMEVRNEMRVFGPMMGKRGPKDGTTDTLFGSGYPAIGTGGIPNQVGRMDDESITASVESALSMSPEGAVPSEITTKDGVVTVKGQADSAEEKDRISRRVRDIRGVKSVRNEMTIAESGPGRERRDRTLTGQAGVYPYPAQPTGGIPQGDTLRK
jgi:osmotically-inducible protein OsmY